MFSHKTDRQGTIYHFDADGYDFHVLHSISGSWTVYEMNLEPHGKTFLDANSLLAHYPVAFRRLRAIVEMEADRGELERSTTESVAG